MTTTTLPTITHRITYDRLTKDYACYVQVEGDPEQYIGSASSYHAGELKCLDYKRNLLESDLVIPATTLDGQCGDCGATLDSMGLCGCGAEEPAPEQQPATAIIIKTIVSHPNGGGFHISGARWHRPTISLEQRNQNADNDWRYIGEPGWFGTEENKLIYEALAAETDLTGWHPGDFAEVDLILHIPSAELTPDCPAPPSCSICAAPALHLEPHGAFCAGCWEASDLWRLWKEDSTEFVAELRRQNCRLHEMAARLATYLNAKNGSTLGCDSILTMWRQLLGDDEPPKPHFYVVAARRRVAA